MAVSKQFVWSDAWILLSIIYAGEQGCDIVTLKGIADYINHAIPTDEELKEAFSRLKQDGIIKERNGRYKAGVKVMAAYALTHTPRRTALKELKDIENFLCIEKTENGNE